MPEIHDDATMEKVHEALRRASLNEEQATNAINEMQNAGILFRERSPRTAGDMPPIAPSPASNQPTLFSDGGADPVVAQKLVEAARKLADLTFSASPKVESDEVFEAHLEGTDCGERPCVTCAPNEPRTALSHPDDPEIDPRDVPPGY